MVSNGWSVRRAVTILALILLILAAAGCARPHGLLEVKTELPLPFQVDERQWARWIPGSELVEAKAIHQISSFTYPDGVVGVQYFVLARAAGKGEVVWHLGELVYHSDRREQPLWQPTQALREDPSQPAQVRAIVRSAPTGKWAVVFGVINDPAVRAVRIETSLGVVEGTPEEPFFWAIWQVAAPQERRMPVIVVQRLEGYDEAGRMVYQATP